MQNEYIFLSLILVSLCGALGAYKLGKSYLIAYVGLINIMCMVIGGNLVEVFGFTVSPATAIYASIFLATDFLAERYGPSVARRGVWVAIAAFVAFVVFTQITLLLDVGEGSKEVNQSISVLSDLGIRFMIAAICAAVIAQNFDIWFYALIHKKTGEHMLWLRNNASTVTSQFLDAMIFWFIAFYGTGAPWLELALTAWALKIMIAFLDTPFVYLAKSIKPLDVKG